MSFLDIKDTHRFILHRYIKKYLLKIPTLQCKINGGGGLNNSGGGGDQKFNRPKTKNYITEGKIIFKKKKKWEVVGGGCLFGTEE